MVAHVEQIMHQLQTFLAVQELRPYPQPLKVIHEVNFNVNEPRLCLFHRLCLNAEGQVLCLSETIVSLRELPAQHGTVLRSDSIEMILLIRDPHHLLKV